MDFTPSETQDAVRGVARDALRLDAGEAAPTWQAVWAELAKAGLLGNPVPEQHGGDGLGLLEVGVLLHEQGRHAVQAPVLETLACAVLTIARCGSDGQQQTAACRSRGR